MYYIIWHGLWTTVRLYIYVKILGKDIAADKDKELRRSFQGSTTSIFVSKNKNSDHYPHTHTADS